MSLKKSTAPPVPQEGADPVEKRSGLAGHLLVLVGALLLALTAGDALADSSRSGGTDALLGTAEGERLAGLGGGDVIKGLAGDDDLYGGEGRDVMLGGTGDDFIEAKDGEVDLVGCGSGDDVASVDLDDRVARDCETLYPG